MWCAKLACSNVCTCYVFLRTSEHCCVRHVAHLQLLLEVSQDLSKVLLQHKFCHRASVQRQLAKGPDALLQGAPMSVEIPEPFGLFKCRGVVGSRSIACLFGKGLGLPCSCTADALHQGGQALMIQGLHITRQRLYILLAWKQTVNTARHLVSTLMMLDSSSAALCSVAFSLSLVRHDRILVLWSTATDTAVPDF